MRNVAMVAVTDATVAVRDAAAVFGLTPEHVSELRGRARKARGASTKDYPSRRFYSRRFYSRRFYNKAVLQQGRRPRLPGAVGSFVRCASQFSRSGRRTLGGVRLRHCRQTDARCTESTSELGALTPAHPVDAIVHRTFSPDEGILHYSWVRDEEYMARKAGWSGHTDANSEPHRSSRVAVTAGSTHG